MPLRRLNLESEALEGGHQQFSSSSSSTTTTPISDRNNPFQTSLFHTGEIVQSENGEMPSSGPPIPPLHLGPPTNQAVSALAQAVQSGIGRRMMQNQNEQIAFDEEHSERSHNPVRRTTSTPRNGSILDDHPMSGVYPPHVRRNSRVSMSNISELTPGPLVLYNPEHMMYGPPPPMMSRAPSVSQLWIPQPPQMPQFAPYYYGPPNHHHQPYPPMPLDPKSMRKAMKNARKLEKKRQLEADLAMDRVGCGFYCCDGVAQLLWLIIAITLLGFVAALILAIYIV